eukprot:4652563-Pyramimonas_sp.AAC.1
MSSSHGMRCIAVLYHDTLCHVMQCYVLLSYAALCNAPACIATHWKCVQWNEDGGAVTWRSGG